MVKLRDQRIVSCISLSIDRVGRTGQADSAKRIALDLARDGKEPLPLRFSPRRFGPSVPKAGQLTLTSGLPNSLCLSGRSLGAPQNGRYSRHRS